MKPDSIDIVVDALVDIVAPSTVLQVASDDRWREAFIRHGIESHAIETDLRSPFQADVRVDLVLCIGAADEVPADVAPVVVASLCGAAGAVAFATSLPGTTDATTARWPSWWDSLFEQHGFVPHDVVRPRLWDDLRVDLLVRQGLVVYAPPERFDAIPLPPGASRSIVHPEAHHRALDLAARRLARNVGAANLRIAELDAEVGRLEEQSRLVAGDLAEARERIERMGGAEFDAQFLDAAHEARDSYGDAVLLWSALVAARRELSAASYSVLPTQGAARSNPRFALSRAISGALPLRRRFKRLLGPSAAVFDEAFYVSQYADVASSSLSPLWHYRRHGTRERRSPHPFFDPEWYAHRYPDVAERGVDPLEDYLGPGWREGRDPHPLFSQEWYATQQSLDRWRRSPLEHYIERGALAGTSPHPLIDPAWYLEQHPDLAAAGVSPVTHFLERGWWEGRSPHPLFELRWYLATYPEVAYQGVNPLVEYLTRGWREGRDPNPLFDVSWYLEAHPDVGEAGVEPLGHYLMHGASEGRPTSALFDTAWYVAGHPEAVEGGRNPLEFFVSVGAPRGDVASAWIDLGGSDERVRM